MTEEDDDTAKEDDEEIDPRLWQRDMRVAVLRIWRSRRIRPKGRRRTR